MTPKLRGVLDRIRRERMAGDDVARVVDKSGDQNEDFQGTILCCKEAYRDLFRLIGGTPRHLVEFPAYQEKHAKIQKDLADISVSFLEEGFTEELLVRAKGIARYRALKRFLEDIAKKEAFKNWNAFGFAVGVGVESENLVKLKAHDEVLAAEREGAKLIRSGSGIYTPLFPEKPGIRELAKLYALASRAIQAREDERRSEEKKRIAGSTVSVKEFLSGRREGYIAFEVVWGGSRREFLEVTVKSGRYEITGGTGQFERLIGDSCIRGEFPQPVFLALKKLQRGTQERKRANIIPLRRAVGQTE